MTLLREDYDGEGNSLESNISRAESELHLDLLIPQEVAELQISPTRLVQQLLSVVAVLVLLSTVGQVFLHIHHRDSPSAIVNLFNLDAEGNIPTAYASFAWMLCSFTSAMIAVTNQQGDRFTKYWKGFALVFAYLALDELAAIHELVIRPMRSLFNASGFFYYAWIIPGGIFFLLFALSCFKFVKTLPLKTQVLFMLAGATFVMGAIGMEMIGGWYAEAFGPNNLTYALITTVEETLEMVGVLILLYALLLYMGKHTQPLKIKVLSR